MVIGANGVNGALVPRHADKENSQELVNVIPHPLSMVEKGAMASQRKAAFATRKCPAQVSNVYNLQHCAVLLK